MNFSKHFFALGFALSLSACAADENQDAPESELGICEQAAQHRAECTGEYITPPECDAAGEAAAQEMLNVPCEDFAAAFEATGKADGAFCDWFGAGCTPDEEIFGGPECASDAVCGDGFCVEGRCFAGVTSDEFQEVMDVWTESYEVQGGLTQLLPGNSETRDLRKRLIEGAESSVHFSAFIIEEGEAGEEMVQLFSDAAERGLDVKVLVDATTQYAFSTYDLLTEMAASGVEIIPFNAVTEWALLRPSLSITVNDRMHEKLLVIDGRYVVMGGRNVGDSYLLDGKWRDTDVYVQGKSVEGIQRMYLHIWDKNSELEARAGCPNESDYGFFCPESKDVRLINDLRYYPDLGEEGSSVTRAVYSDPLVQETPYGYFTTLALVRGARKSITIANSYFVPPRRLRKHLRAAAARGVEVNVLTNSLESTDAWWMYYASLNYYKELIGGGINIYQYKGTETMHAKTMLIDDEVAVVGSFNLDPRSAIDNSESMLVIREGAAVQELKASLDEDFAFSDLADDDIPLKDLLKAKSFRLVEPLL